LTGLLETGDWRLETRGKEDRLESRSHKRRAGPTREEPVPQAKSRSHKRRADPTGMRVGATAILE